MRGNETQLPPRGDPWRELGLEPGAGDEAVHRAYRKMVRRYPPELAPERFARIQQAYDTLRTPGRLLAEARDRPEATLLELFPVPGLELAAEPDPPPAAAGELEDLMSFARRTALVALLASFAEE